MVYEARDGVERLTRDLAEERKERYIALADVGRLTEDVATAAARSIERAEKRLTEELEAERATLRKHVKEQQQQSAQEAEDGAAGGASPSAAGGEWPNRANALRAKVASLLPGVPGSTTQSDAEVLQAGLAKAIGEMDAELRVEVLGRISKIGEEWRAEAAYLSGRMNTLGSEIRSEVSARVEATEARLSTIEESSAKELQKISTEVNGRLERAETTKLDLRVGKLEAEVLRTSLMVRSLAEERAVQSARATAIEASSATESPVKGHDAAAVEAQLSEHSVGSLPSSAPLAQQDSDTQSTLSGISLGMRSALRGTAGSSTADSVPVEGVNVIPMSMAHPSSGNGGASFRKSPSGDLDNSQVIANAIRQSLPEQLGGLRSEEATKPLVAALARADQSAAAENAEALSYLQRLLAKMKANQGLSQGSKNLPAKASGSQQNLQGPQAAAATAAAASSARSNSQPPPFSQELRDSLEDLVSVVNHTLGQQIGSQGIAQQLQAASSSLTAPSRVPGGAHSQPPMQHREAAAALAQAAAVLSAPAVKAALEGNMQTQQVGQQQQVDAQVLSTRANRLLENLTQGLSRTQPIPSRTTGASRSPPPTRTHGGGTSVTMPVATPGGTTPPHPSDASPVSQQGAAQYTRLSARPQFEVQTLDGTISALPGTHRPSLSHVAAANSARPDLSVTAPAAMQAQAPRIGAIPGRSTGPSPIQSTNATPAATPVGAYPSSAQPTRSRMTGLPGTTSPSAKAAGGVPGMPSGVPKWEAPSLQSQARRWR
eukprot:gnl/TRDRNA2_/TRDRNA2_166262_c6_seq1.p1 gnl/TRDRNA2_/TRDRNA2_166262_c6~~gnl/TRDRNA2_/TRDRNA2_166262_c6_seq1.p1  ORF type:complete len:803 (+),score=149.68 gnl/TRDRNA2_/TRDRNA2_166262_c6_seq1:92-2410(+)